MARDQVEVMRGLGFGEFAVVGHDRGARVAHRMALDHAERITKLALLDIIPTSVAFASVDKDVLEVWRSRAEEVRGAAFDCGHFLPEEDPGRTASELISFLA